jgi:hypothetical protein
MKIAVFLCGSLRKETSIAYKSWHFFEPCDYFLITWDQIIPNINDKNQNVSLNDVWFRHKDYKSITISNFDYFTQTLSRDFPWTIDQATGKPYRMIGMLYNWSIVSKLDELDSYDQIIITRPDAFFYNLQKKLYQEIAIQPIDDKIYMSGQNGVINDKLIIAGSKSLQFFSELYKYILISKCCFNSENLWINVHCLLWELCTNKFKNYVSILDTLGQFQPNIIRPDFSEECVDLNYGIELISKILFHELKYKLLFDPEYNQERYANDCDNLEQIIKSVSSQ